MLILDFQHLKQDPILHNGNIGDLLFHLICTLCLSEHA